MCWKYALSVLLLYALFAMTFPGGPFAASAGQSNQAESEERHTYDNNCPLCKRDAREAYFTKKTDELAGEYPQLYAEIGHDNARGLVRMSLEKGERHNLRADREVNGLRIMMLYLGCDFDIDPMYPWARLPVFPEKDHSEENPESWIYLQKVYATFYDYYHDIAGDDHRHLVAALERFQALNFHQLQFMRSDYELLNTLAFIYPERYAAVPESAWPDILLIAEEKARRLQLDPVAGKAMMTGLMFFCGVSVDYDPVYARLFEGLDQLEPYTLQREYVMFQRIKESLRRF